MITRLLIANRGEIAVRIARTAAEMNIATVAVYPDDDAFSLHVREAHSAHRLPGVGPSAYLDTAAIVGAARLSGCDAVHPGYGFLSESAAFARACEAAGLIFVGPTADALDLFGDKSKARVLASQVGIPVLGGTTGPTTLEQARAFMARLAPDEAIMVKAIAGGGGCGMRPVADIGDLEAAFARCAAEAKAAFGDSDLYVERLLTGARHIEVQVLGDGHSVTCLGDRECSLQRRRQKLVEWAPAERLPPEVRDAIYKGSGAVARATGLRSLCTVEYLVADGAYFFIEANARLQVEHTVTEQVTGLDLVRAQLLIAGGASLPEIGLDVVPVPRGCALQVRVNCERMGDTGNSVPAGGVITAYSPPSGRGIRVDGAGYEGLHVGPRYDSLIAKLIVDVSSGGVVTAAAKASRALADFRITGVETNIAFIRALLGDDDVRNGVAWTTLVEERMTALIAASVSEEVAAPVLAKPITARASGAATPKGTIAIEAAMIGILVALNVRAGDDVVAGQEVAIIEAMKMQHGIAAPCPGTVAGLPKAIGDMVAHADPILFLTPSGLASDIGPVAAASIDLDSTRADFDEVEARRRGTRDAGRPDAVARRRKTGQRTARENIDDLCDPESFVEYGALAIAGRSRRATAEQLIAESPADGLIMGLATVSAADFGAERARVAVMAYDYTVFAGTQGARNHIKTDRIVELADRWRLPFVLFAEGGGGRPGDTDGGGFIRAFEYLPKLSGKVPMIGIVSGRCFAGNAAFLGCCDVIIATRNATIGMGGPAMIEGGGLGTFKPEDVGPAAVHVVNGVIDVLVDDEAAAVATARQYLAYFQGPLKEWTCVDQRLLRHAIPENRLRVYDIRNLIEKLADTGTVLELRHGFGNAMVTMFARIEGRPVGVLANDPGHLGGAIDSDAADKAARFMQLCEAHGLPLVSLSDTPGIMVGPEVEKTALVRHAARMFLTGANLTVPLLSVVLRKSYGLGAIAMTGGSYQASVFSVAWPSGEFGGMGLEGAVKLGWRRELDAIADPVERQQKFDALVAQLYEHGKALTTAGYFGIDDVIDPAETRRWITAALGATPPSRTADFTKRLPWIDSW